MFKTKEDIPRTPKKLLQCGGGDQLEILGHCSIGEEGSVEAQCCIVTVQTSDQSIVVLKIVFYLAEQSIGIQKVQYHYHNSIKICIGIQYQYQYQTLYWRSVERGCWVIRERTNRGFSSFL